MSSKDLSTHIRYSRKAGWTIELTNGGHNRWTHPSGALFFSGSTPSDRRAMANIRRVES